MKVGDQAPDFQLNDQHGNTFILSENLGDGIVLVFYPKDETAVCTKQLGEYSNRYEDFLNLGFQIVGISVDSEESHRKFSNSCSFRFRILSDNDKSVSSKYKALSITGMSKRKIVFIYREGVIRFVDSRLPIFYLHSAALLKTLKSVL